MEKDTSEIIKLIERYKRVYENLGVYLYERYSVTQELSGTYTSVKVPTEGTEMTGSQEKHKN